MADHEEPHKANIVGPRFLTAGGFDTLYREGMGLIEEVAAYLDGDGRTQSRELPRDAAFVYATESMRLTTRLMQIASWLLLQRAVQEGEITAEHARDEKQKVNFSAVPAKRGGLGWEHLPERLTDYIGLGDRLFERVQRFEKLDRGEITPTALTPKQGDIADQRSRLMQAFGLNKSE